jgi:hypothetical protein
MNQRKFYPLALSMLTRLVPFREGCAAFRSTCGSYFSFSSRYPSALSTGLLRAGSGHLQIHCWKQVTGRVVTALPVHNTATYVTASTPASVAIVSRLLRRFSHQLNSLLDRVRLYTMPTAKIIDGKAMAQAIRAELKKEVDELRARHPYFEPHLAVVQVGGREDSSLYIRQKERAAQEASDDRVVTCTEMTHHLL